MSALTSDELRVFAGSVDGEVGRVWPSPTAAGGVLRPNLASCGRWLPPRAGPAPPPTAPLDAVMVATNRLGRTACALPLVDAYVAVDLLGSEQPVAERIAAGEIRPVVAMSSGAGPVRYAEAASAATHVLELVDGTRAVLRDRDAYPDTRPRHPGMV